MFCKACGNEVLDTTIICPKCGSSTGVEEVKTVSPALLWGGWLSAIFLPIVGIACGIVIATRKQVGMGIGMVVTSIFAWIFWIGVLIGV